ncbi:MAG: hypothetical protein NTX33_06795 [Propionibacteriales bacterium]|nr:hypothetical protein [Propionibacteriales bacterium]
MKKFLLGAIAVTTSVVAFAAPTQAEPGPYTGTVGTTTSVSSVVTSFEYGKIPTTPVADVTVTPASGITSPAGLVRINCSRISPNVTKLGVWVAYAGPGALAVKLPDLGVEDPAAAVDPVLAAWSCVAEYDGGDSVHQDSTSGSFTVTIVPTVTTSGLTNTDLDHAKKETAQSNAARLGQLTVSAPAGVSVANPNQITGSVGVSCTKGGSTNTESYTTYAAGMWVHFPSTGNGAPNNGTWACTVTFTSAKDFWANSTVNVNVTVS